MFLEFNENNLPICAECGEELDDFCFADEFDWALYCKACFLQLMCEKYERCTSMLIEEYDVEIGSIKEEW